MTTTYTEATDEIFALLEDAVSTNGPSIVGYTPTIVYQGVENKSLAASSEFWAMAQIQTVTEFQTTHKSTVKKRYTAYGFLLVQLFAPKDDLQNWYKLKELASKVKNGFRGKTTPGHIVFRNARCKELQPDEIAHKINVIVDYEYDEIV